MNLVDSPWHVFSAAMVLLIGLGISLKISRYFGVSQRRAMLLYLWHSFFCFTCAVFVIKEGGDGLYYYSEALNSFANFKLGTDAIVVIATPFASLLGLSFLGVYLVFNIFGSIGLLAFYGSLRAELVNRPRWVRHFATLIVFLPSVSFWSSGLGKDALSFMAAGLALWAALNPRSRTWLMALAIAVMLVVRPHIASIMLLALTASYLMTRGVSLWLRVLVLSLGLWAAVVLLPIALDMSGIKGDPGIDEFNSYIEKRASYNMEGGGGVNIASMNPLMRVLTYLFRPLPFEAHSAYSLAASFENVIILALFAMGAWGMILRRKRHLLANTLFMWFYAGATLFVLAMTTANLGISVRQKWMFLPMLIYLFLSVLGRRKVVRLPLDAKDRFKAGIG